MSAPPEAALGPPERVGRGATASQASVADYVRRSGLRPLVIGVSKDPNAKVTILLVSPDGGRPVLALKVPTTAEAERAVLAEIGLLAELGEAADDRLLETVPRVVRLVEFEGRSAGVMTALQGVPMTTTYMRPRHTADRARVAADFAAVGAWLAGMQTATARARSALEMDAGVTARLADRFAADGRIADDVERLREIHHRLRENVVPRTAVHGDLWMGNVLVSAGAVSGVVDWEAGASCGEPVRDLVRFAHMYALYLDRRTRPGRTVRGHGGLVAGGSGAGIEYALTGSGWFPELFRGFIADGLARLGAARRSWADAALAGIAEVAALTDEPGFARLHLELFRSMAAARKSAPPAALFG